MKKLLIPIISLLIVAVGFFSVGFYLGSFAKGNTEKALKENENLRKSVEVLDKISMNLYDIYSWCEFGATNWKPQIDEKGKEIRDLVQNSKGTVSALVFSRLDRIPECIYK